MDKVILLIFLSLGLCDSALDITQCERRDKDCQLEQINKIFQDVCHDASKYGVAPINPYEVNNFRVTLLGTLDITLIHGWLYNLCSCVYTDIETNFETGLMKATIDCKDDLKIDGNYTFSTIPKPVGALLGGIKGLYGDGHVDIKVGGFEITFYCRVKVYKGSDGQSHYNFEQITHPWTFNDFHIYASNIMFGSKDLTPTANKLLQENSNIVFSVGAIPFIRKAGDIYMEYKNTVSSQIPTFIKE